MNDRRKFIKQSLTVFGAIGFLGTDSIFAQKASTENGFRLMVAVNKMKIGARYSRINGKHLITIRNINGKEKFAISFDYDTLNKKHPELVKKTSHSFTVDEKNYTVSKTGNTFKTDFPKATIPEPPPPSANFFMAIICVICCIIGAGAFASVGTVFALNILITLFPPGLFKEEPDMDEKPNIWY